MSKDTIPTKNFIVALGASAGGLSSYESFFRATPEKSGLTFVVISHLSPTHISHLPELLQKYTTMPVYQVNHDMAVQPNVVYVIPPDCVMTIEAGVLKVEALKGNHSIKPLIDTFFYSLAADQGQYAIGVVLSGTGTDGSKGLEEIAKRDGLTIVQSRETSAYDGMPASAQGACSVDFTLAPTEMPQAILSHLEQLYSSISNNRANKDTGINHVVTKIYSILLNHSKHDFSHYKKNTILRRIERRMELHQIDRLDDYATFLIGNENEVDLLFYDLLIGVTSFFRDPKVFETLQENILPSILEYCGDKPTIRLWCAGCSTGEEVYSLAILLHECMSEMGKKRSVQIFATDIDTKAIEAARIGIYPKTIESDLSSSRLNMYFTKEKDGRYKVKQIIREMIIFANHNLIKDPPFTKVDMISCRNLLIYFESSLQKRLFPLFHYAIKENGILLLGVSETVGNSSELFFAVDKKNKIFKRISTKLKLSSVVKVQKHLLIEERLSDGPTKTMKISEEVNTLQLVEAILRKSNTPPCVLVDSLANILYIHGRTSEYLGPVEGKINVNLIEMARPDLKQLLAAEMRKANESKNESSIVDIRLPRGESFFYLDICFKPILDHHIKNGYLLIIFREKAESSVHKNSVHEELSTHIELELQNTRDALIATIDDLELSNNELKNVNEELQSANEELQSANEELETSKEELQSLNEESITINSELQSRIDELSTYSDDMKNLLDSTDMATVFLDMSLCIRRFTTKTTEIIPLMASDLGRAIGTFSTNLIDLNISTVSAMVLDDLKIREFEVQRLDQSIFAVKFQPYRTTSNLVDGVVIIFEDITLRKKKEAENRINELRFRTFFELANDSMAVIDGETMLFTDANENAYMHLGYTQEEFRMLKISDIETKKTFSSVTKFLDSIPLNESFPFETSHQTKLGDIREVRVKVKPLLFAGKKSYLCTWRDK